MTKREGALGETKASTPEARKATLNKTKANLMLVKMMCIWGGGEKRNNIESLESRAPILQYFMPQYGTVAQHNKDRSSRWMIDDGMMAANGVNYYFLEGK